MYICNTIRILHVDKKKNVKHLVDFVVIRCFPFC